MTSSGTSDPDFTTEWTEQTAGNIPADRRFLQSAGPFTLQPGAVNEITTGVIYDPIRDECFFAEKGNGAWLNDKRLRVSGRTQMIEMLFSTGIPFANKPGLSLTLKEIKSIMPKCSGLRRDGSAALDLAYVASGRFDGYWERGLNSWDIAAGIAIVESAGGKTEVLNYKDNFQVDIVLSNSKI